VARFGEDGLRPMRAIRFVAQLGFDLDGPTGEAIPGALPVVRRVAAERLTDELSKLLVASHPAAALVLLGTTGLLAVVLPPLAIRPAAEIEHALRVAAAAPPSLAHRLAALLHLLKEDGAAAALAALRLSRAAVDETLALVRAFPCLAESGAGLPPEGPAELRRWLSQVDPRRAAGLLELAEAEVTTLPPGRHQALAARVKRLKGTVAELLATSPPLSVRDLALDGRAVAEILGSAPGPQVGEGLRHLLDRVLERPEENTPERLRAALREWSAHGQGRL
jgi:tRNA nucleotidyltransferase (CCA-adding enzyme)